jgi:ribosome-associated toxin RatA of RatAB toxin-antitoxin module
MRRIARSAIVECSRAQVYDLVEDIESYPQFLPWCVATQ